MSRYYLGALAGAMGRLNSMNINQGGGMKLLDPGQIKLAVGNLKKRGSSSGWKEKPSDPEAFTSSNLVEGPGGQLAFDKPYANPHSAVSSFQPYETQQAPPQWLRDYMNAAQGMQKENENRSMTQVGGVPTQESFKIDSDTAQKSLHDAQVVKGLLGTIRPNEGW